MAYDDVERKPFRPVTRSPFESFDKDVQVKVKDAGRVEELLEQGAALDQEAREIADDVRNQNKERENALSALLEKKRQQTASMLMEAREHGMSYLVNYLRSRRDQGFIDDDVADTVRKILKLFFEEESRILGDDEDDEEKGGMVVEGDYRPQLDLSTVNVSDQESVRKLEEMPPHKRRQIHDFFEAVEAGEADMPPELRERVEDSDVLDAVTQAVEGENDDA